MLFNSIEFAIFLPIVFMLYWFVFNKNLRIQNFFIVVVSYIFYGWWDWKFLILIALTSITSWGSGVLIEYFRHNSSCSLRRYNLSKLTLIANVSLNLAILGFFKYYNFFVENFVDAFLLFNKELNISTLKIILPVGISFYTFQAISYSIDVYNKKINATKNVVSFLAFVSFFPQLVAGPIERATNLLPQFHKKRVFCYDKAVDGMRQILWGLFKKVVVADNCSTIVNNIFETYQDQSSLMLVVGALFFTFQIYGDFSGYSDIAIGTSRLLGFNLMRNFNFPYFSRDIAEFWRRWHISLTTWLRDYVYIPLGGSRGTTAMVIRNTFIIFLVSGFWHGANWTFIAWGLFHALLFLPLIRGGKNRKHVSNIAEGKIFPSLKEVSQVFVTFSLVSVGWIIFRAESMPQAVDYIYRIFDISLFDIQSLSSGASILEPMIFILLLTVVEWLQRDKQHGLEVSESNFLKRKLPRRFAYFTLIVLVLDNISGEQSFIYFQF